MSVTENTPFEFNFILLIILHIKEKINTFMQKILHIFHLDARKLILYFKILFYMPLKSGENMKLLIITADKRQVYMSERLLEKGFDCTFYTPDLFVEGQFDGVVFALPGVKFSRINCEYDVRLENILSLVKKGGFVFSAMVDEAFLNAVKDSELINYDYYSREELVVFNAHLTAEGVLELVLVNSNVTLRNLEVLVTGYGKTGEAIADILSRNFASVTVAARKEKDRARVISRNMKALSFDEIKDSAEKFDFVINTVPAEVIGKNLLSRFRQNCVFLEIASKPYGIDVTSAENQGKKVIIASSLPGKYVARSAGFFIADTITNIVKEEGIND